MPRCAHALVIEARKLALCCFFSPCQAGVPRMTPASCYANGVLVDFCMAP